MKLVIRLKGGKGSGDFGHAGRPGKVGGSAPKKVVVAKKPETFTIEGETWEAQPPKFVNSVDELQKTKDGDRGYFILGDGRMVDIGEEFGGGSNDHVGFAVAGDNYRLFGMTRTDAKKFLTAYMRGEGEDIGEGWNKIFNSGAIRVRIFGNEVNIETNGTSKYALQHLQKLMDEGKLKFKPGVVNYWSGNRTFTNVRFTYEEFIDASDVDNTNGVLKEEPKKKK